MAPLDDNGLRLTPQGRLLLESDDPLLAKEFSKGSGTGLL
jgi:hypothetical protein